MSSQPVMTPVVARNVYNNQAAQYHITYACYYPEVIQLVTEANLTASDTVLDLGTGIGWVARQAAETCALAIGLDISPKMIDQARIDHAARQQSQNTDRLARFAVANMQDVHSINSATTQILQEPGLMDRLRQAGASFSATTPPKFTVVLMHLSFSHIDPTLWVDFLKMVKEHLLAENGRLVIAHEASRCDMYCIQEQWLYHPNGRMDQWVQGYFGKSRVGGKTSEQWTRNEIKKVADSAGLVIKRSTVMNKDPVYGFKDLTKHVHDMAVEQSGQQKPDFDALEVARKTLYDNLGEAFETNQEPNAPKEGQMHNGKRVRNLQHTTRHSVTSVMVTLQRA